MTLTKQKMAIVSSTIMMLIIPLLTIPGLISFTNFAFNAAETWKSPYALWTDYEKMRATTKTYSEKFTQADYLNMKIAAVTAWILVVGLILSWVGKATGMFCLI